jgi:uncharacterized membrane protein YdjX (TVP38/TMEM64 family)
MMEFVAFAFYVCISCCLLVIAPVMMIPALPMKRKLLISFIGILIFVPFALVLYSWLGAPQMAARS